jgi:hypothetical protein
MDPEVMQIRDDDYTPARAVQIRSDQFSAWSKSKNHREPVLGQNPRPDPTIFTPEKSFKKPFNNVALISALLICNLSNG